eukprot:s1941_g9.t1
MCEGSAFQRVMRVEPSKLKTNSLDGVKALVAALGGIWGKTDLEDRFDLNDSNEVNLATGVHPGVEESIFVSETDESFIDALIEEGDPDALICHQFEEAILDVLQGDTDTASCYLTYMEARKRLSDRNRNRGFWAPGASQNNAKGAKGRGKSGGKFSNRYRKPLAARILESECRRCGQKGHWKAECPLRSTSGNAQPNGPSKENATYATMTLTPDLNDMPSTDMIPRDDVEVSLSVFGNVCGIQQCLTIYSDDNRYANISQRLCQLSQRLTPLIKQRLMPDRSPQPVPASVDKDRVSEAQPEVACFASHGSYGIVDLGASQSVIGHRQLAQVLDSLDPKIREQIRETRCDTVFRFGNSSTVHCDKAMLIPLGKWFVKLCIVPSDTPFLLSNNMFRTLGAQIDTASDRIFLAGLNVSMDLVLSEKKLYLLDFGQLTKAKQNLAERFRRVMDQAQQSEGQDYTKMTMEELGQSVITFGEAKKGQTFEKVLQTDQSYVAWFTGKFASSQKYEHRRFLFYIQKFVDQAEAMQSTTQPKSRSKPKGPTQLKVHLPSDTEEIPDLSDEESSMWDIIEGQRQQINQLENNQSQRISQLEVALGQIVGQLRELTCHLKGPEDQ